MTGYSFHLLDGERVKIRKIIDNLSLQYFSNRHLSIQYLMHETNYSDKIIAECKSGRIDFTEAMSKLLEQKRTLNDIAFKLMTNDIKMYLVVERIRDTNSVLTITLKQVGFISGSLQFVGGLGICKATLGAACGSLGLPLMAHGLENGWENGYYLVYRNDSKIMPVRQVYRKVASLFGGDNRNGDIAYSIGDLSLSAGSLFRSVLKPDSWKLFYYIRDDFILGWKDLGAAGLATEIVGDSASSFTIYQLHGDKSVWNDLAEPK